MGILSSAVKGLAGGVLGGQLGALIGGYGSPSTRGLSAAERKALDDAKADEDARRLRMLDMQKRRARVALGVRAGQRTLLFGSYTGTPQS